MTRKRTKQISGHKTCTGATRPETSLSNQEKRFRSYIEHCTDIIMVIGTDNTVQYVSPSIERVLGYHPEEITGTDGIWLIHPDDQPMALNAAGQVWVYGGVGKHPIEIRYRTKDGLWRYFETLGTVFTEEPGERYMVVNARDVTERKAARDALERSEKRFLKYLASSSDLIVVVDLDRVVRYASPSLKRILGYESEEIVGRMINLVHPDDAEILVEPRTQSRLHPGEPMKPLEVRHLHKDGSVRYLELIGTFIVEESGEGYTVMDCRDTTERRRIQDVLAMTRLQLEAAVDLTGVVYWEVDARTEEFVFNDAFYALYGTTAEQEDGYRMSVTKYLEFVHPDDADIVVQMGKGTFDPDQDNRWAKVEHRIIRRDGAIRHITSQRKIIRGPDGSIIRMYGANQDITERKEAEEKLHQSRLQLAEAMEIAHVTGWELDLNTREYIFNDAFYASLGTTAEAEGGYRMPLDMYITRFLHPDDVPTFRAAEASINATGDRYYMNEAEYRSIRRDGEMRYIIVRTRIAKDEDGNLTRIYGTNQDITERVLMEKAVRTSEAKYRMLAENMSDMIWSMDPWSKRYTYVSPSSVSVCGYTPEELLAMASPQDMMDLQDRQLVGDCFARVYEAVRAGRRFPSERLELQGYHKNGSLIWVEVSMGGVYDETGQLTALLGSTTNITERKKAEEALQISRLQLSTATELTKVVYWEVDTETDEAILSDRYCSLLGITTEDGDYRIPRAELYRRFIHPDDAAMLRQRAAEMEYKVDVDAIEHRIIRQDGAVRHVISLRKGLADSSGHLTKIYGTLQDITERKEMEAALHRSEEQYRLIADNASDMIWTQDPFTARYTYVSPSCFRLTGYTPEQIIGKMPEDLLPPDSLSQGKAHMKQISEAAQRGERVQDDRVELRLLCRDGGSIWVESVVNGVYDDSGRLTAFRGATRDITERKRMEEALRASEEKYRMIIESAVEGIFQSIREGRFVSANPAMARILGYETPEELISSVKNIVEQIYVRPDDRTKIMEAFDTEGMVKDVQVEWLRKDGASVWLTLSGHAVYDRDGNVVCYEGIAMDTTERRQTHELLALRAKELARSNEELEQFAYIASHDLQEPLRMVAGYAELLGKRYSGKLDDSADDFINFIIDGANRMKRLIDDLLAYSRVGTRTKTLASVALNDIVDLAMSNLALAIEDCHAHVTRDSLPHLTGDDVQLVQLFQNLIANAIKFHGAAPPKVHIWTEREEGNWVISVKDNGIGIDPKNFERIFIIFQRLHGRGEYTGTGIGLAVCKKIVERHGGNLWVESEPGQGAVFKFTIPATAGDSR